MTSPDTPTAGGCRSRQASSSAETAIGKDRSDDVNDTNTSHCSVRWPRAWLRPRAVMARHLRRRFIGDDRNRRPRRWGARFGRRPGRPRPRRRGAGLGRVCDSARSRSAALRPVWRPSAAGVVRPIQPGAADVLAATPSRGSGLCWRALVLPARWQSSLTPDQLACVRLRRALAGTSGAWLRGRIVALVFTLAGIGVSAAIVGPQRLGTAGGTIELSLWFTLWSFAGLLILPTVSRRGVAELDVYARSAGVSETLARATVRALDAHQDEEPDRPALVETIFHPIPSVRNRDDTAPRPTPGAWDAARTAVYLGLAGGGLLGRAVHCNCGRPALWVFLPVD